MLSLIALFAACSDDPEIKALKPDIVLTPEILGYGEVVIDYSAPGTVQIINAGRGILEVGDVTIEGDGAAAFTVEEVPAEVAGESEEAFQVTFLPTQPIVYSATLTVHSNDEDTPAAPLTLTGAGIEAPTPDIVCDPLSIDFSDVPAGSVSTNWFTCTNVGTDDLFISSMTQSGGGAFSLVTDPTGFALQPDQSTQLIVVYAPTTADGDNGTINLFTNDPDEPATLLTMVGNGGGDFEYPEAVLDCPGSAVPRETVTVGGGGSNDPNGHELTFHWNATGPYDEVLTTESGTDLLVQLDLAGEYQVTLQVENSIGLLSAPTVCRIDAVPDEEFHVELVWGDINDFDLHLMNGEGTLFDRENDCNFCNVNPDWGSAGPDDDPTLDIDALTSPPGIENINIQSPADDTYSVKVHYFTDGGAGDVTATVRVYLYGVLEGTYARVMSRNDVWDVAEITWPDGFVSEATSDLYEAELRYCE